MNLTDAILTDHAAAQIAKRALTEADIRAVLAQPEQVVEVRPGRVIAQSVVRQADPDRPYLVRVVVDTDRQPPEVVTAYRTSRMDKYRSRL
jgi:hypothetical protein